RLAAGRQCAEGQLTTCAMLASLLAAALWLVRHSHFQQGVVLVHRQHLGTVWRGCIVRQAFSSCALLQLCCCNLRHSLPGSLVVWAKHALNKTGCTGPVPLMTATLKSLLFAAHSSMPLAGACRGWRLMPWCGCSFSGSPLRLKPVPAGWQHPCACCGGSYQGWAVYAMPTACC
ncbi:hypothetical protein COO60DRAFT_1534064, partial [Scenedesmus sp. NREL 46B-D3]